MAPELCWRIFFQLPLRYAANPANAFKPFISKPAGGAAIPGIVDDESFIAVGGDFGLVSDLANDFDAVQYAFSRRP